MWQRQLNEMMSFLSKEINDAILFLRAATYEAGQEVDIKCPPAGVLITDGFLNKAEIAAALKQLDILEAKRSLGERIVALRQTQAERQFIINMPEVIADRLRQEVDAALGIVPSKAVSEAPRQERLPARVIYGPTVEHVDEPKSAAPWANSLEASKNKDAYREGYVAIVYLAGDGALVLGSGPTAREVPVVPGRLVAWPNTCFVHSAYGQERRLLGPLAVIPGDHNAPLWLTVKGYQPPIWFVLPIFFFPVAQLVVGSIFLGEDAACSPGSGIGLALWSFISAAWKLMYCSVILTLGYCGPAFMGQDSMGKLFGRFNFLWFTTYLAWLVYGAIITSGIPVVGVGINECSPILYLTNVIPMFFFAAFGTFILRKIIPQKIIADPGSKSTFLLLVAVAISTSVASGVVAGVTWSSLMGVFLLPALIFPLSMKVGLTVFDIVKKVPAANGPEANVPEAKATVVTDSPYDRP